jgi:hypothetical protein
MAWTYRGPGSGEEISGFHRRGERHGKKIEREIKCQKKSN